MAVAELTRAGAWRGEQQPLVWGALLHADTAGDPFTFNWSQVAITDSAAAGGYKDPRLLGLGQYKFGLSTSGRLEGTTFSLTIADADNQIRAWLENQVQVGLLDLMLVACYTTVADRALGHDPIVLFRGLVKSYTAPAGFTFTFACQDWLSARIAQPLPLPALADFFPGLPAANRDRSAPIWYGAFAVPAPPAPALPAVPTGFIARTQGTPGATHYAYNLSAFNANGESALVGWVDVFDGPAVITGMDFVRLDWDPQADATGFVVYGRDGGGQYLDLPASSPYNDNEGDVQKNPPAIPPPPPTDSHGLLPTIHVGTGFVDDNGDSWEGLVVAAHALTEISAVYQDGAAIADGNGEFAWPGKTGFGALFSGADPVRVVAGQSFTLIYVRGAAAAGVIDGTKPVTLNLLGIEDVGDGSGALIADGFEQARHLFRNYVLPDTVWTTGAWAGASPTWPDTTPRLDEAALTAAASAYAVALPGLSADRAWGVTVSTPMLQVLADLCLMLELAYVSTKAGQLRVVLEPPEADPTVPVADTFTETDDIGAGAFSFADNTDPAVFFNRMLYSFQPIYSPDGGISYGQTAPAEDIALRAVYARGRVILASQAISFIGIRDATVASQIAQRIVTRASRPERTILSRVPMYGLGREPGDVIGLTHREGTGAGGFVNRRVQLRASAPEIALGAVDFECRDLGDVDQQILEEMMANRSFGGSAVTGYGNAPDGLSLWPDYRPVAIDWSLIPTTWKVRGRVWTINEAGASQTPRVYNCGADLTGRTKVADGVSKSGTGWEVQLVLIPRESGLQYYLILGDAVGIAESVAGAGDGKDIKSFGDCEITPV